MEGWKVAAVGGQGGSSVVYITWYWSSLWRTCSTSSNAVSNCYDFPMLWSVESLLAAAGYAVYARHITAEFFNPSFELKKIDDIVPAEEALHSIPTDISISSKLTKVSTVSDLSSKSSTVYSFQHKSHNLSKA
ncbi:Claudin-10 [Bagarius yarrelli]|uniref:Claudin-10 n=1 Tax=Bagarius yarrelli TaxID=175774 RepID=A0A556V868_BAGYA|nr:Claudin-10 [Bagarius yarrelli]